MARTLQKGHDHFAEEVTILSARELARGDLAVLAEKRAPQQRINDLRDRHHRIARAVASGMNDKEVCFACGISTTSLARHKADPAFRDLVAQKRAMLDAEWVEAADPVIDVLRDIKMASLNMLADKVYDAADRNEFLPTRDLLGMAELSLDRTGYGKVNKNLNINGDFAAILEAARARAKSARSIGTDSTIIDGEVVHSPDQATGEDHTISPPPSPALRRI